MLLMSYSVLMAVPYIFTNNIMLINDLYFNCIVLPKFLYALSQKFTNFF